MCFVSNLNFHRKLFMRDYNFFFVRNQRRIKFCSFNKFNFASILHSMKSESVWEQSHRNKKFGKNYVLMRKYLLIGDFPRGHFSPFTEQKICPNQICTRRSLMLFLFFSVTGKYLPELSVVQDLFLVRRFFPAKATANNFTTGMWYWILN